ncbi:hypothetical protein QQF64_016496 [Cirrhinus molitorella]|uniref:Uncharacterized protein n=1 Tax=Cirrhinus molitorella TaxID=172907 RepID=A0ABR3LMZ3_9TELE
MPPKCRRKTQLKGEVAKRSRTSTSQLAAVTRIRTGVAAATTQSTNHYTITARHWFTAGGAGRPNTKRASGVSAFGWQGARAQIRARDAEEKAPAASPQRSGASANSVVGRIRTCAGRPQWISSPSP